MDSSGTVKMALHPFVLADHVLQVALARDRLADRILDDAARLVLAELAGERERHRLGHDQAARDAEIGAHALGIDVQAVGDLHDRARARPT